MYNYTLGFFNAYQGTGGVYISFGNLKKFYLRFGEHTKSYYIPSAPVFMYVTSEKNDILLKTGITPTPGEKCMITLTGNTNNLSVIKINEPLMQRRPDRGYIRFINLSSLGPASLIQKGQSVFSQVEFCERTNYILSAPGIYHFTVKAPNITKSLEVKVEAGDYKTIYFIGNRAANKTVVIYDRKIEMPQF